MKLFFAAASVQTGRVRIFDRSQLAADVIMASACLPYIFQAVSIEVNFEAIGHRSTLDLSSVLD
jgi:predicted acylesterase/phospholipase RssA